jgi:hypothetical protein
MVTSARNLIRASIYIYIYIYIYVYMYTYIQGNSKGECLRWDPIQILIKHNHAGTFPVTWLHLTLAILCL